MATVTEMPRKKAMEALRETITKFKASYPKSQNIKTDLEHFLDELDAELEELKGEREIALSRSCCDLIDLILEGPDVEIRSKLEVLGCKLADFDPEDDGFHERTKLKITICA